MLNIKIGKRMTINTGNYSSIQPSAEVELTDVKPEEYEEKVEILQTLVDGLLTLNTMEHAEWMQHIKDHGLNVVLNSINIESMKDDVSECIKRLEI